MDSIVGAESGTRGFAGASSPVPPADGSGPNRVQTKLRLGAHNDRFEQEADAVADKVVRRMRSPGVRNSAVRGLQAKAERQPEEPKETNEDTGMADVVQASSGSESDVSPDVEDTLKRSRGSGHPLNSNVRGDMEDAFQRDFSNVRVHTGSAADTANSSLDAKALTHGSDIYFGAGEFQPDTQDGRHLLAHELTHVVQQNPGLNTKRRSSAESPRVQSRPAVSAAAHGQLQAASVFGPRDTSKFPSGSLIHKTVLPMFADANSDLFIEVKIPGATARDVDTNKVGVADLYKASPTDGKARTIAIKYADEMPKFLTQTSAKRGFAFGGGAYSHNKEGAPKGAKNKPKVRDGKIGPKMIWLGDLKPGHSAEAFLGSGQIANYKSGITNTAENIKSYLKTNKDQTDGSGTWTPIPSTMTKLEIPAKLQYPTGSGISPSPLAVWESGALGMSKDVKDSTLSGSMYVYKHKRSGIWAYEWIPKDISERTGAGKVDDVSERLQEDVIDPLSGKVRAKPKSNRIGRIGKSRADTVRRRPKKKHTKFPYGNWKLKYKKWKGDAKTFLGDDKEENKGKVLDTLLDVDKRFPGNVKMPAPVKERAKGLQKIRHWNRLGGVYGWLRNTFDGVFIKLQGFAASVKKKVKRLSRKIGGTSFGNWVKAAAKVIFKIFKLIGSWAVTQALEKLMESLQEGISNNIKKLLESVTPEGVKSKIEQFEEKKAEYQALIDEKQKELEEKIFGDKLALFDKLSEFEAVADKASKVVALVEWGVRLLACASPPAIGCLWNLAISALQAAFGWLMQTCWFTKKVAAPVINKVKPVREFPAAMAALVVKQANDLLPMPAGFGPIFAKIEIDRAAFKPSCPEGGGAKLSPEREALLELLEEVGEEKFKAMMEVVRKRGVGPWVLMTADRIKNLEEPLKNVKLSELKKLAKDPDADTPVQLEEFLENIKKHTKKEKGLIKETREKKAAEAAKKKGGDSDADGPSYDDPIYESPGKATGDFQLRFRAAYYGDPLVPGKKYPRPLDVYMKVIVYSAEGKYLGDVNVKDVSVKIQSVTDSGVVLVNQRKFYAYYNKPKKYWVVVNKDERLGLERRHIANVE